MVVRSTVRATTAVTSKVTTGSGGGAGGGGGPSYDTDAQTFFTAVEAEDGEALEAGVKTAFNDFFVGLKDDGLWDDIHTMVLPFGARTFDGALVPLKGTAPTNVNFVSGDYARGSGLTGNGTTKYLNSNVPVSTAGTQNDLSFSTFSTPAGAGSRCLIGAFRTRFAIIQQSSVTSTFFGANAVATAVTVSTPSSDFFCGVSRSASGSYTARWNGTNHTVTDSSTGTISDNFYVFARNDSGTPNLFANSRICWYHVGTALNLATLETRVAALLSAIGAALA